MEVGFDSIRFGVVVNACKRGEVGDGGSDGVGLGEGLAGFGRVG